MDRVKISDIFIDNLEWDRIRDAVRKFIGSQKAQQIITANSLMVNYVAREPELKGAFHNAGLVLADSVGIVWASEFLGYGKLARIPGIELMLKFCQLAASKDYSIYLLGARESVLKKAGENLKKEFPGLRIVGMHHGYFTNGDRHRILKEIKNVKPDFLFVGMGTPRGEKWIYQNLEQLNVPVCMGIGGSLDVISGRLRRAPAWLRQGGFEWTYRVLQEPWRVVRLPGLLSFVWKIMKQKWRR
ncbi:WecB/TagA/CpsF family glycosyltransferase [bacterium]|nr:WecB/TagA/CpsF family glycosyltransferase [bacterium]NIN92154.1 WecB/TagA/CpsF family glycosyltransferase [bacterium]NIO18812.1 WecB/TagA/CpsF family glycosyltransferase [bacterium]NIO73896.1 WecB/TagA/CpsF family glycosyltransferase [bacterium]